MEGASDAGASVAGALIAGAPVQLITVQDTVPILWDLNGSAIHKFVGEFRHFLAKTRVADKFPNTFLPSIIRRLRI